ncbi:enhancer of mRNA-decapping protein 4 [Prorops nasuta]|uniref:enhancer of mRNA-decapping protein 4 n=1 Tax=Prorops nasuta TaxID=863751 RepID=UPI0034CDA55F
MIKAEEDNLGQFFPQTVEFNGQENHHSVELYSRDVLVVPPPGGHDHGSSKVKLKNIVDFSWEHKLYSGQLLAVHMSGKYLAYAIKVGTGNGGVVRVVHKEMEQRALLRGMRGSIQDLAFAHVTNAILACIDSTGILFIHTIESTATELLCNLVLQVDADDVSPTTHRVIWCPYIPEEGIDGDEVSKLLVLTRGSKAELWSVTTVASRFRSVEATSQAVKECGGMLEIGQHTGTIVEATFSPDGTALATASLDGEIKFFQVVMHGNSQQQPRCLHQWKPHNGKPISCLFFLDDHKNCMPDVQFWRFAVTGCDNNSEIKIWSCELWTCLQTIKFGPNPTTGKIPVLKAGLDLSAGYLLLSDIYSKVLYILNLSKDGGEAVARVSTISEFLLPNPILSFGIVDAGPRKIRPSGESLEDLCPFDEDSEEQLLIRMYVVQPKSLQECHIAFKPAVQASKNCLIETITHDSLDYSEDMPEIGSGNHNGIADNNGEEDGSLSATLESSPNHNAGLNLMTPDAFSSPAKKESNELDSNRASPELGDVLTTSPSMAKAVQALNTADPPLTTNEVEDHPPISGGSSPSREVREILSLKTEDEQKVDIKTEKTPGEGWHNIPMVLLKESVHAMQEGSDFRDGGDSEVQRKSTEKDSSTVTDVDSNWQTAKLKTELMNKLDSIAGVIQVQRTEMRELRAEVNRLRQETPLNTKIDSSFAQISSRLNTLLERAQYRQANRLLDFMNVLEPKLQENIEKIMPRIVEETVMSMKHQIRLDVEQINSVLKENLTQLVSSSQVKDNFSKTISQAAKPALDTAFKDAFTNVLLPGMEKACQTMFRQVQDAFVRGTREYLQNVEAVTEKQNQRRHEQQSEALANLIRQELQSELTRGLNLMQEGTIRTVRDSIRDNLSQQLTEITTARSRATTPAIPVANAADVQARVMSLLQRGQLNAAFQQALSASDLSLVVSLCERTEPSRVFSCPVPPPGQGTRCVLQQPVILSLVQQLSADLGHRTELKHRYLEEAILNLDPNDPVTREHMGTVLLTLQNQLATFVTANPNHRSSRRMKMLGMAASALLSQHP